MKARALTETERHKFYQICYHSKLGTPLTESDMDFLQKMRKLDWKTCSELSTEASTAAVADYLNMWKTPS
jgi:hypothetical protein